MSGPRVLFHTQNLLGVGHERRSALIATAMVQRGLDVTVVRGGFAEAPFHFGGARILQLPPVRAADESFRVLSDREGRPVDAAWEARRQRALLKVFRTVRPHVLLIEGFPFARRRFRFELLPLLSAAAAKRVPAAVSVRDILVTRTDPDRNEEIVAACNRYNLQVLVHSDPSLVRFEDSFPAATRLRLPVRYTGYVAPPPLPPEPDSGEVVISAGGGRVGAALFRAAIAARRFSAFGRRTWRIVTGPNLPAGERACIETAAGEGLVVERFRPDLPALCARAQVSVSQAGYNTVVDLLAGRARAVLVPFAAAREDEQPRRAAVLAAHGLASVVPEGTLEAASLAAAIDTAGAAPRPAPAPVDLGGAVATAAQVEAMAAAALTGSSASGAR